MVSRPHMISKSVVICLLHGEKWRWQICKCCGYRWWQASRYHGWEPGLLWKQQILLNTVQSFFTWLCYIDPHSSDRIRCYSECDAEQEQGHIVMFRLFALWSVTLELLQGLRSNWMLGIRLPSYHLTRVICASWTQHYLTQQAIKLAYLYGNGLWHNMSRE